MVVEREIISQKDLDQLLHINEFIEKQNENSLVGELKEAILDSGKLELAQWESLREHISEIEDLIPHIELIIKLKKNNKKNRK
ncbi:hypothetical protein EKO29_17270 [Colwellia sp. Arc7-635]|uniref:hypothetical protein n=1 Tax=Colwellia sp. Arc7-635 TaxID=2497879 RepID=UPI000F852B41|nr:hypothetical protein [Colwellia sp. Arc7-635]AZQ85586.1 hypothetical protein EKO29_17270 [Colwellia sp. Arc7-635]